MITWTKNARRLMVQTQQPVSEQDLKIVHTDDYLSLLNNSRFGSLYLAQALELPLLQLLPVSVLKSAILVPMRWATMGTIVAAEAALTSSIAINLSGGYHHASQDRGEGFCIYSDIAIAIAKLRLQEKIKSTDKVAIIDLDAHQGNGLERIFYEDESIYFFDMYNQDIYPGDQEAKERINSKIELSYGTDSEQYLKLLTEKLPLFLSNIGQVKIAFYNAGTDIFDSDPLGGLKVSKSAVLQRDIFVSETLTKLGIPWTMVLSGGYTRESYILVADSVSHILKTWGQNSCK